jgi:hypothetical protein
MVRRSSSTSPAAFGQGGQVGLGAVPLLDAEESGGALDQDVAEELLGLAVGEDDVGVAGADPVLDA